MNNILPLKKLNYLWELRDEVKSYQAVFNYINIDFNRHKNKKKDLFYTRMETFVNISKPLAWRVTLDSKQTWNIENQMYTAEHNS